MIGYRNVLRTPRSRCVIAIAGFLCAGGGGAAAVQPRTPPVRATACAIVYEIGVGDVLRQPATGCDARVSPQSTFKIPHALAVLDAGVLDPDEVIAYDGRSVDYALWRRDHTLATAMRYSVVWFFQTIATRLGPAREREYLERLDYGNHDSSSGLTTFWLGGSLAISPDEQRQFLLRLFGDQLPIKPEATQAVWRILIQPPGHVTNATGEHPFGGQWREGTVLRAKTGSGGTAEGGAVRWLVGHIQRGSRAWVFVSNVVGGTDVPALAAVEQAERALAAAHVLP